MFFNVDGNFSFLYKKEFRWVAFCFIKPSVNGLLGFFFKCTAPLIKKTTTLISQYHATILQV